MPTMKASGGGYGSPTTARMKMGGYAKKGHKGFKSANVKGSAHNMSGKKLPSKRKMKGSSSGGY